MNENSVTVTREFTEPESGSAPIVREREKHIVSELKKLQGIAERQEMFRNELMARLSSVTRLEQIDINEELSGAPMGVPLADDLSVVSRSFAVTNAVLEDILNRLEI